MNKLTNVRFDNGTLVKDTDGTPAYPTYNTADARSTVANGVARTPGSAAASCATVYCHSIGNLDAVGAVITAGGVNFRTVAWNTTIAGCDDCHGDTAGKAHPTYASGAGGSTTANSHVAHVETMAYACDTCHNTTTTSAVIPPTAVLAAGQHLDRTEDVGFNAAGTSTWVPASKTCTTSKCHGTNSAAWGANTATAQCVECHGVAGTTPAGYTADTKLAAPGASNNTGVDTDGTVGAITRGVSNDTEEGAHYGHLYAQSGISSPIACTECHAVPANTVAGRKTHLDGGDADFLWGTLATKGGTMTPAFDAVTHTCSNNRCHNVATNNHTTNATDTTPTWNDIAYFGDVVSPLTATECNRCHYYSSTNNCNSCHDHVTAGAPNLSFITPSLHINGAVESSGGTCIGCHASIKGTRRATVGEFSQLHGHKMNGRGAVTDADCYPCHYEANQNGTVNLTYHGSSAGDGTIHLRGNSGVIAVTAFSRNLDSNTLDAAATNVQTHCLACHDGSAPAWVAAGSSTNPWATGYAPVNVSTQLATSNTSFHPVLGVQNNAFCDVDTMMAPWNVPNGTHKQITCFDCHAKDGAAGIQTSTTPANKGLVFLSENEALAAGSFDGRPMGGLLRPHLEFDD
ncbi:MAG: CxxxxCH/CxxCH domain-containing protein, partial [Rhodoferax sp.]|nr:CxxxxCH/CxxCH domain-containing protein [Rhodoferax sp.]